MLGTIELTNYHLLEEIRLGNTNAFQEFYYRFHSKVNGFAFKFSGDMETAKEITQETFVKFWESRERINIHQSPEALLYIIVKNSILDKWKKELHYNKYLKVLKNERNYDNSTIDHMNYRETTSLIENLVNNLPVQAQKVYRLSREEGYTHQQIANELEISTNTVSNHIKRSINKIKKLYHLNYSDVSSCLMIFLLFF